MMPAGRRLFLASLGALGLSALIPSCGRPVAPLRIVSFVWPGYEFMFLAQGEGWISSEEIQLIRTRSVTESMQALADGRADGAALTMDEVLRAREAGIPLQIVLVFDISLGADVLLAKPGIETLSQLKDRRIGLEASGLGTLMLHKALEAASLKADDVQVVPVTFDHHLEMWQSGQVDALITFEPVVSTLRAQDARSLFDSSKIPDTIVDVLAVRYEAVRTHREALHHLVAAHFQGLAHLRKNPYDTAYRMAERFKLSPKEVIAAYKGLELPNENRNRQLLHGKNAALELNAQSLGKILAQAGILKDENVNSDHLVTDAFIPWSERR